MSKITDKFMHVFLTFNNSTKQHKKFNNSGQA